MRDKDTAGWQGVGLGPQNVVHGAAWSLPVISAATEPPLDASSEPDLTSARTVSAPTPVPAITPEILTGTRACEEL